MIEVVIKGVKYVDDLPVEESHKNDLSEQLHKRTTIGLLVQSTEDSEKTALIELYLTKDEQKTFIKEGSTIGVEQRSEYYVISGDWEEYHLMQENEKLEETKVRVNRQSFQKTGLSKAQPKVA